jgi:hypothetical protein
MYITIVALNKGHLDYSTYIEKSFTIPSIAFGSSRVYNKYLYQ